MGNLFEILVDCVVSVWQVDTDARDNSIYDESPMERKDRKLIGWICGSLLVLLIIGGLMWWCRTGAK